MAQDFSKKMTIVVRDDVASWQLTNTVAHVAAYLGNKMSEPFDTGKSFVSKDNVEFPRNSQYGIVALKANRSEIQELAKNASNSGLLWIAYVQEMIDLIDDAELEKALSLKSFEELDILGIGFFGSKDSLKALTGGLKLFK